MLILWIAVFCVSLFFMVKGADWLIASAEKIGLAFGLSPFIIGITIVGVGTSLPELISALAGVWKGVPDIVAANAVGSNIANILLIIGLSAVAAGCLTVKKSLIDLDLPLLFISTIIFLGAAWDKKINLGESIVLLAAYGVYLLYTGKQKNIDEKNGDLEVLPSRSDRRSATLPAATEPSGIGKISIKDVLFLLLGLSALAVGAKYLIDSLIAISTGLHIATGLIAITAVAFGTSLPELLVSIKAAWAKKSEIALGNIFGSNVFNILVVVGLPGLFKTLPIDDQTYSLGLPLMAVSTLMFVISGISRKIHIWEGAFFLITYVLFLAKLFSWF
ncbi:conjugal transfer protein TraR [Candidatus Falkowbacteria bacterium CG_4_10_14_0_2_um_filter_48_10]|uniref:Conjugal transfer protein TraR n=1 Tax=Candidatus Falkowbacteria bacterium CG23_combo_of_CG06-09_8_20_14_all_49_15 TaxID=1974572 RepID=A0A2G9ZLA6_9BACT|nr:MAG: conjugal transfer protein TraR [Candidatus Falkowbacteria bacterium CG23_combo_of_CG06-09_8_20_14_all_49_15]PJA08409.1 MAG: conjugal transfer protein TraR [Candidatus Falkowbacteria bacterium CG_4_10_14_0_2_um_filter_48_10]